MTIATPAFAIVRPRVVVVRTGEARLLEEVVAEILEEYGSGFVRLTGGPGSGKTTALAHLAAVFSYNERVIFLDQPTPEQMDACLGDAFVIAAMPAGGGHNLELALQPWGLDELIEYLLAEHHDACGTIIERLGPAARHRWLPEIAVIVMDRFARDASLNFPTDALLKHVDEQFRNPAQRLAAAEFCLAMLIGKGKRIMPAIAKMKQQKVSPSAKGLLRHEIVQIPFAADSLCDIVSRGESGVLECELPRKLLKGAGRKCATTQAMSMRLNNLLETQFEKTHAMAASILLAADATWRPPKRRKPWNLAHGVFSDAQWSEVDLAQSSLISCDFCDANLAAAILNDATLNGAHFDGADLSRALLRVTARGAHFQRANLCDAKLNLAKLCGADFLEANLSNAELDHADLSAASLTAANMQRASLKNARLVGANLEDADLTGAVLHGADLTRVDLRRTKLDQANLEGALLKESQLEDVRIVGARMPNAKLFGTYLTGSCMRAADMRGADMRDSKLAEIDWEGADLRGANLRGTTFHMGSSRSGLVGSPYACEGSKTGFYTDDFEDLSFRRPEEIRKANLANADLRGLRAERVDFYLVDLRGAKMDAELREQARESGAILHDPER